MICKREWTQIVADGALDSWDRPPYPGQQIETVLIALQPLAKRYHWTPKDFFFVMCKLVRRTPPNWCWGHDDLEPYRQYELDLPPLETPDHQFPEPPAGLNLACNICPPRL